MIRSFRLYVLAIGMMCLPWAMVKASENVSFHQSQLMEKSKSGKLEAPTATLEVKEGVMKQSIEISLSSIGESQLPKLDRGMTNVTDSFSGYRFLPHGEHFEGKGARVALGYDRTKIPSGYTEDDIRTYYYDEQLGHWVALQRDSVDRANRRIISHTTHFTDMINGVIQAPESPETQGFAPTMMSDLQAADPTAKIQMIQAPQVNSNGTASLSYSLEMPPARNGMAPNLTVQYSSDAGSGWLGEGWNLTTSAITVDTRWGVPRYNQQVESETYLLDGQMLLEDGVGLSHRNLNQTRKNGNVTFYPRKENAFSKIVRIGNNPSNYIWEVTDRKGTKYTYGAYKITEQTNAAGETVKDTTIIGVVKGHYQYDPNNPTLVISEWRLTRIEEIHGDYVEYLYNETFEPVAGGYNAISLYLDTIKAGNKGQEPHTVVVLKNKNQKNIKRNDARYGYLTSSNMLLDSVNVYFEGEYLRGYKFEYTNGAFGVDLLKSISHLDNNRNRFSTHKLEYNQQFNGTQLYDGDSEAKTYTSQNIFSDSFFKRIKNGFGSELSMINGTSSTDGFSVGGGCNAGVGPAFAGVSYNYGQNTGKGSVSLTDLNGDGLPDKVYSDGSGLHYQRQLADGRFEDPVSISGPKSFAESSSSSHSLNEDVGVGIGPASISATFSQTWGNDKTSVYFNDFNSDGLIDIACEGSVFFNHLDKDGKPTFTKFSSHTDNALGKMDKSYIPKIEGLSEVAEGSDEWNQAKDSLENAFPMHDIVRVWKAPFAGTINISGTVVYDIPQSNNSDTIDGVTCLIQKNNENSMFTKKLSVANNTVSCEKNGVSVNAGDYIFFRLNSTYQGWNDRVRWSPTITYQSINTELEGNVPDYDEYGFSLRTYDSKEGFSRGMDSSLILSGPCKFVIKNQYQKKNRTFDDLRLETKLTVQSGTFSENFQAINLSANTTQTAVTNDRSVEYNLQEGDTIKLNFFVSSDFPVYDRDLDWTVLFEIIKADGNDVYKDSVYLSPYHKMYNNIVRVVDTFRYSPERIDSIAAVEGIEGVTEVSRTCDTIQIKINRNSQIEDVNCRTYLFESDDSTIVREIHDGEKILIEDWNNQLAGKHLKFITYSDRAEKKAASVDVEFVRITKEVFDNDSISIVEEKDTSYVSSLYSIISDYELRLGQFYRGWGQFAYLGETENGELKKIDMNDFDINKDKYDEDKINEWAEKTGEDGNEDISKDVISMLSEGSDDGKIKEKFYSLIYNTKENKYYGATTFAYLTADSVCSSRLGNPIINVRAEFPSYDLKEDTPDSYGAAIAPIQSSKSFTNSATLGGGVSAGKFGIGAGGSWSKTTSNTLASVMDLNGDGYPDWLSGENDIMVLYTNQQGVPSEPKTHNAVSLSESEAHADALSVNVSLSSSGGGCSGKGTAVSNPFKKETWTLKNLKAMAKQRETSENSLSVSAGGNYSNSESTANKEWYDVNGDGLPDMIVNGDIHLNLGYNFVNIGAMNGTYNDLYTVQSSTSGAGMGIGVTLKGKANISGGTNASFTESASFLQLMDVNGDGLPDKITVEGNSRSTKNIYAQINTGNAFDTQKYLIASADDNILNKSKATSLSVYANGGFTFYIPPLCIVSLTPFVNGAKSWSVSRTLSSLSDFDGDGFPDLLESNSESQVKVRYSRIGATNKLKSVTNPFGGKYTIEYTHTQPTTNHPGGKWAMASLIVSDSTDNPKMISKFRYEDGRRDRREREFLGFGKVYSMSMEGSDTIRTLLQEFDVNHYLTAGSLTRSLLAGKDTTAKFRDEHTDYRYYSVSGEGTLSEDQTISSDRLFSVPSQKTTVAYENGNSLDLNRETYTYGSNYGNLDKYQFEDLTNNNYGYLTTINYANARYGTPNHVTVKSLNGDTYRDVTASYANEFTPWAMTEMKQKVDDKNTAVATFEYDHYGNIAKKTLPKNAKGEQMFFTYLYDRKYNMYPESVEDAFGYRSQMEDYDYRYGIPRTVRDMNGYTVQYHIDDLGRVDTIIAPNEQSAGVPYTIAYQYVKGADYKTSYAVTSHYDPQHPNDPLMTITHVDGLGRPYQVKKEAEIMNDNKQAEVKYIVSGRTKYDALGRTIETTHPTSCAPANALNIVAFNNNMLNSTTYDAIDRPLTQTLPAEQGGEASITRMNYTIENSMMKAIVTAPNDDESYSYTNGAGQTVNTERIDPSTGEHVSIKYFFDPIGQLDSLIDAGGNVTKYVYDMAGRKLSVCHPSAGLTSFIYDNAGNILKKGTANGDTVKYEYEYNRLVKVKYPRHPENDVTYTYGGHNATYNRAGRIALVEDGSGATEYFYGKMGEVTKQRRTLIIPNVAVATYTTEWQYDSHNRLQEMIYPDGEKVKYFYNLGGQLSSIVGEKKYLYRYIDTIGYDMYEQRKYMKYGNGVKTDYAYSPNRRRLSNVTVASKGVNIMDNTYAYDVMDNIISLVNNGVTQVGKEGKTIGGYTSHTYTYDKWNRLINAVGSFRSSETDSAHYNLTMTYDKLYNVTSKKLDLIQENLQFAGRLETGHEFTYHYDKENTFKLLNVSTKEYTSDSAVVDTFMRVHHYDFDANGNQTMVAMNPVVDSTCVVDTAGTKVRQLLWDEENRLLSINDNGFVSNYFYDVNGERTVKLSTPDLSVFVNGTEALNNDSTLMKFVGYVSPYLVVTNGGRYTKHIYAGTQRIASKIGDIESFGADPRRVAYAGANIKEIDFGSKYDAQNTALIARYDSFNVDNKPKENNDYVGGTTFCCGGKSLTELSGSQSNNEENAQFENDVRFYHPDHLGSTTVVTDLDGEVTQNVAYIPYGEVFVEQRNGTWNTPYLFNAKELDEETGLYYYGARYLNPKDTRWLSVDPMFEKYAGMSPYNYCAGNPVKLVDPTGERPIYDEDGNFLGTDETGLQGNPIVMWKDKFVQGMSETEANQNDLGLEFLSLQTGYTGDDGKDPYERFLENYTNLSNRPDWDGFVSVDEGVQWAKEHPGALNNPTSENTLYINAAMLDFGPLSTNHFAEENVVTPVNLFPINTAGDFWEAFKSRMSEKRYGTVYALGRCNMILRNRNARTVTIVNDEATDYDWNGGGAGYRNDFIEWERKGKGLDDRHGFKVFYYGVGVLNK